MYHEWNRRSLVLVAALVIASGCAGPETGPGQPEVVEGPPPMEALVSTEWLSQNLNEPDLVVLDCTVLIEQNEDGSFKAESGRAAYENGHIPTAGFADLKGDLCDGESPHDYALPEPERFAEVMGALGVGEDSRVVVYDATGSAWAARVWWMLRWIGFDRAAILDGGLGAWQAEGRLLSTEAPAHPAKMLTAEPRWELIADRDAVLAALEDESVQLIDVMPEAHYRGEMAMYDRPGHIPSAINIPVTGLVDESGHFRPLDELAAMHDLDLDARVITYCGGGIAASSNAFVMTRLGFTNVAVYTASLQEWAADPDLPMEAATP
jgi:thiosulfate/3-mercaptopyruvate sulfurtransferase